MLKNVGVSIMAWIFLCLTFNSTFPLERFIRKSIGTTQNILRHQKFGNNTELIKDGVKVFDKSDVSQDDLWRYEQLVIMKKYPYLDFNEYESKYRPLLNKNIRQSIRFHSGNDPGLCEPMDDLMNVEIINRGLSGFAIPIKLSKPAEKVNPNPNIIVEKNKLLTIPEKPINNNILKSLQQEINAFIGDKIAKT